MTVNDSVLIAALVIFVGAWWLVRAPWRDAARLAAAVLALAAGLYGVFDDRWQAGVGAGAGLLFLLVLVIGKLRGRPPRRGLPVWSGLGVTAIGALAVAALWLFPVNDLPAPAGEYAVGVRSFELADASRPGVFAAGADEPRRLLVRVWYPAASVDGRDPRPYFDAAEAAHTARGLGELLRFPPFLSYLKHAGTHSYEDAPLLAGAAALPTVLFSHGYTSFLGQNTALMEELASHGYAVYAVQHTYDASATVFPDGEVAPTDPALYQQLANAPQPGGELPAAMVKAFAGRSFDERLDGHLTLREQGLAKGERLLASAPVWLADRLFVHDRLQRGEVPAAVADVVAASRLDRVGELGMSFGGSTTGGLCVVDPRCAAGVNLDGGDFDFGPFNADMPQPFLMFHADFAGLYRMLGLEVDGEPHSFNEFSYERFEHAGERADIHRLTMKDVAHLGLSDLSWFMRRPLRDPLLGSAPAAVMLGAQNDIVRGFFDKYLRGLDNGFPAPQYQRYEAWIAPYDNAPLRAWWQALPEAQRAAYQARIDAVRPAAAGR